MKDFSLCKDLNIGILAEAGELIGLGHLKRSNVLAKELAKIGAHPILISNIRFEPDNSQTSYYVSSDLEPKHYWESILRNLLKSRCKIFIVDVSLNMLKSFQYNIFQNNDIIVVIISGWLHLNIGFDLFFHPSPVQAKPNKSFFSNQFFYSGPEFLVLRDEFKFRTFKVKEKIKRILITMGGADPLNITNFVCNSILEFCKANKIYLDVIIGPYYSFRDELIYNLKDYANIVHFYENIENMPETLLNSDLIIINGGMTRYEIAALGIPFIAISMDYTQYKINGIISEKGGAINLGLVNEISQSDLLDTIKTLNNPKIRKKMSDNLKSMIDFEGTKRIINTIYLFYKNTH